MADETETQSDGEGQDGDARGEETRESPVDRRRRDAAIKRAQAAETKLKERDQEMAELREKLDQLEGKGSSIDKVLERKDAKIKALEAEILDRDGKFESLNRSIRTDRLVSALVSQTKLPEDRVRGLIAVHKMRDPEADDAPEALDDITVKSWIKSLQKRDPASFETADAGKSRPRPGPASAEHQRGLAGGEQLSADGVKKLLSDPIFQPPADGRRI